jgi:hypothetical protein
MAGFLPPGEPSFEQLETARNCSKLFGSPGRFEPFWAVSGRSGPFRAGSAVSDRFGVIFCFLLYFLVSAGF